MRSFTSAFPSFVVISMRREDGTPIDGTDFEQFVTTEDLVPPQFLACPPPLSERTFYAGPGSTMVLVTLPEMTAFDNIDPSPIVEYPFSSANLSVIGMYAFVHLKDWLLFCWFHFTPSHISG